MIFVIGGYKSGKKQFVINNFNYNEKDFSKNILDNCKVLYDLHELEFLNQEKVICSLLEKEIVICNEIGCGLVPINKNDRVQRENMGRLCIELAQKSECVYRVYAGIGIKIK